MRRVFPCSFCDQAFSRRWNLQRHTELRHRGQFGQFGSAQILPGSSASRYVNRKTGKYSENYSIPKTDEPFFPGMKEASDMAKDFIEFGKVMQSLSNNGMQLVELDNLRQQVNSHSRQLSEIYSNYWLVPKNEIQGVSGYLCPKCNSFDWHFIRNVGYDLTAQAGHKCDTIKIAQNKNGWEQILLRAVNFYMPGFKHLFGLDVTPAFKQFSSALDSDMAKKILGIPERYVLHNLQDSDKLVWLKRVFDNPGTKVLIYESEVLDFLRNIKSTYAIFEISSGTSIKMIGVSLVGMI